MLGLLVDSILPVNCRIGSLERCNTGRAASPSVNCRIGSLEIRASFRHQLFFVNCRIGSLENAWPRERVEGSS